MKLLKEKVVHLVIDFVLSEVKIYLQSRQFYGSSDIFTLSLPTNIDIDFLFEDSIEFLMKIAVKEDILT